MNKEFLVAFSPNARILLGGILSNDLSRRNRENVKQLIYDLCVEAHRMYGNKRRIHKYEPKITNEILDACLRSYKKHRKDE